MKNDINYHNNKNKTLRRVTISDINYKLIRQFSYTRAQLRSFIFVIILVLFVVNFFIISYTPLRYWIQGYPSKDLVLQMQLNAIRLDSLYRELQLRNQYIDNIKRIFHDDSLPVYAPEAPTNIDSSPEQTTLSLNETIPEEDKELRDKIEKEEQYTVSGIVLTPSSNTRFDFLLLPPVNGLISNHFDRKQKHFGIDIVSMPNQPVLSAFTGKIIDRSWSLETGYMIYIQHTNGLVSGYKHLSSTFVRQGDRVKEGQPIGTVGNTGELSSGPHLHFELWFNGHALDPEYYINFQ